MYIKFIKGQVQFNKQEDGFSIKKWFFRGELDLTPFFSGELDLTPFFTFLAEQKPTVPICGTLPAIIHIFSYAWMMQKLPCLTWNIRTHIPGIREG